MGKKKISAAIVGASGYLGGELLRLLLLHPHVEIGAATSESNAGKKISELHPNLQGFTSLSFTSGTPAGLAASHDVIFFALPHGVSMNAVAEAHATAEKSGCKLIDLSGDFRIPDSAIYEKYYKMPHTHKELLKQAVYGLPELNREKIKGASLVANPGCFPTAALLSIAPFSSAGLISGNSPIIVDAATGSSGAGVKPSAGTHHPERMGDFRAYEIFTHRHTPEMEIHAPMKGGAGSESITHAQSDASMHPHVIFTAHSGPWVRGILTTAYIPLKKEMSSEQAEKIVQDYYKGEFFIRCVQQARVGVAANTNFVNISAAASGKMAIVTAAIDNLMKGGSGQAVQNMNIMFGLDEKQGLMLTGGHPG